MSYILEGMKVCTKCNVSKSLSSFGKGSGGNYRRSECKECITKLSNQRKALREQYGQPPAGYLCKGCYSDNPGRKNGTWCIDHCHITGKFKSWLCHECNTTLGLCKDNPDTLERLAKYAREYDYASERKTEREQI